MNKCKYESWHPIKEIENVDCTLIRNEVLENDLNSEIKRLNEKYTGENLSDIIAVAYMNGYEFGKNTTK